MGDNDAASIAACTRFSTLTSMAASKYPSAIRPSRQSHLRPAAACTVQTSASVDQVERNALAIELTAGQAELEELLVFPTTGRGRVQRVSLLHGK